MAKRYPGIREIVKGEKYEIGFQINGKRFQYRISASSIKEAHERKIKDYSEKLEKSRSIEVEQCANVSIERAWELLSDDIIADNKSTKAFQHYKRTFDRMYRKLLPEEYPDMKFISQTSLQFLNRYKSFYVSELGRTEGWRAELTFVKAMIRRFYKVGLCDKSLVEDMDHLVKPRRTKKEYVHYQDHKIRALLDTVKRERPDYYRLFYYLCRTGRRIEETTQIERKDVEWNKIMPVKLNIRAITTKQRKNLPLNILDDKLSIIIRESYLESKKHKTVYLFTNRFGKKVSQKSSREYLKKISKKILGKAITPHYFRHRFLTKCGSGQLSMQDAMSIAGITDLKVVIGYYNHNTDAGLEQVFKATDI